MPRDNLPSFLTSARYASIIGIVLSTAAVRLRHNVLLCTCRRFARAAHTSTGVSARVPRWCEQVRDLPVSRGGPGQGRRPCPSSWQ